MIINKDYMLHFDMYVKNGIAEFLVNGIPVKRLDSEVYGFNSMVGHHYLIDGENTFEIVINPGPTPSTALEQTPIENDERHNQSPKALIQLMKYEVGSFAGDTEAGEILMQLNWEYNVEEHGNTPFPIVAKAKFQLAHHMGEWAWQQCEKVNLRSEKAELTAIIEDLYSDFTSGNSVRVVHFLAPYLQDAGRALSAYGTQSLTEDVIDDVNDNKALTAEEFDTESLDFRVCGANNLVQIVNKDWQPTLRIPLGPEYEGDDYTLDMFVGKVNGRWQAVL